MDRNACKMMGAYLQKDTLDNDFAEELFAAFVYNLPLSGDFIHFCRSLFVTQNVKHTN